MADTNIPELQKPLFENFTDEEIGIIRAGLVHVSVYWWHEKMGYQADQLLDKLRHEKDLKNNPKKG